MTTRDEDLGTLAELVRDTFGEPVLFDAVIRALAAAPPRDVPPAFIEQIADAVSAGVYAKLIDAPTARAAVKAELQRILRAH